VALCHTSRGQVDNLRVLLLDDVLTAGANSMPVPERCWKAGAKSVVGLTVARPRGTPCQAPKWSG